jgi:hypothetical protein
MPPLRDTVRDDAHHSGSGWRGPVDSLPSKAGMEVTPSNLRLDWLRKSSGPAVPNRSPRVPGEAEPGNSVELDARRRNLSWRSGISRVALTVECWARPEAQRVQRPRGQRSNVRRIELYSYGGGDLSVHLPGRGGEPSEASICDDRWHHVVAVLATACVRLYVDGQLVKDARPLPRNRTPGGGLAVDGRRRRCGVRGWVDEVRLTKSATTERIAVHCAAPRARHDRFALSSANWRHSAIRAGQSASRSCCASAISAPVNRDRI